MSQHTILNEALWSERDVPSTNHIHVQQKSPLLKIATYVTLANHRQNKGNMIFFVDRAPLDRRRTRLHVCDNTTVFILPEEEMKKRNVLFSICEKEEQLSGFHL